MKTETDLIKEIRSLRKEVSLLLRRQELMLEALVPQVKPTKDEMKIIRKRKEFGREKELFKALR
jgi:hypothetical protein